MILRNGLQEVYFHEKRLLDRAGIPVTVIVDSVKVVTRKDGRHEKKRRWYTQAGFADAVRRLVQAGWPEQRIVATLAGPASDLDDALVLVGLSPSGQRRA